MVGPTSYQLASLLFRGPLTRYVKLLVAHVPGIPGTFSVPPTSKETTSQRSQHASRHMRAAMHIRNVNPQWWGKYSQCMRNPQFYVSDKRPMSISSPIPEIKSQGPTSYQLSSLLFHVNRPSHSWYRDFSKFDLGNPWSKS